VAQSFRGAVHSVKLAKAEKARGRRVLVFVQGTDKRDITRRLKGLLAAEGLQSAVLKSHTTSAENREAWVENRLKEGLDVLICHPRVVQIGLDLIAFPTLTYFQVELSVFTLRQASRRSWRSRREAPGQGCEPGVSRNGSGHHAGAHR